VLADGRQVALAQLVSRGDAHAVVTTDGEVLGIEEVVELEDVAPVAMARCWVCGEEVPAAGLVAHTGDCEAQARELEPGR
jgi:hypothetical protein